MIFNKEQWTELWYTLRSNKRRSIVTSIGVFAGMFFFTVLVSLGTGLSNSTKSELESVASNLIFFLPGKTSIPYEGYKANRPISPTYQDYQILQNNTTKWASINCFTSHSQSENMWDQIQVVIDGDSYGVLVISISPGYNDNVTKNVVLFGRDLRSEEVAEALPVCVIGREIAEHFAPKDPSQLVGKYAQINGIPFQIVGVVEAYTDAVKIGFNPNYSIQIPIAFSVRGQTEKRVLLAGVPQSGVTEEEAKEELFGIMQRHHHIHPDDKRAVVMMTMSSVTNLFNMTLKAVDILIWIVGMGTLLTGVIGVSNILLVTVSERQREIGIRRALGAKPSDIRKQFMAEAIAIILVAGLIGTFMGLIIILGIGAVASSIHQLSDYILRPYPSPEILLFSVGIILVAGILAGLLPVYKALKIKAIEAIRDE